MQQLTGLDAVVPGTGDRQCDRSRRRGLRAGPARRAGAADADPADRAAGAAAATGSGAAAQAAQRAARARPAVLGRRPGLRHRVPHPRDRAAASRLGGAAHRAGGPAARASARPTPAAVGDVPDHRAGQEARRGLHEDPSRGDRRRVRRGAADRAARPDPGRPRAAAGRAVPPGPAARPGGTGRARRDPAGLAAGADGSRHQRGVRALPTLAPAMRRWSAACSDSDRGDGGVIATATRTGARDAVQQADHRASPAARSAASTWRRSRP